jgi:hypothetical protein
MLRPVSPGAIGAGIVVTGAGAAWTITSRTISAGSVIPRPFIPRAVSAGAFIAVDGAPGLATGLGTRRLRALLVGPFGATGSDRFGATPAALFGALGGAATGLAGRAPGPFSGLPKGLSRAWFFGAAEGALP